MKRTGYGWMELMAGIIMLVAGVISLFIPASMLWGPLWLLGAAVVLMGLADCLLYTKMQEGGRTWTLIMGIGEIIMGAVLLFTQGAGTISVWLPIALLVHNVARFVALSGIERQAGDTRRQVSLWMNILAAIGAVVILFAKTGTAWGAISMLLLGVDSLCVATSDMAIEKTEETAAA